jgi:multiple sugar transport system permease protein
MRYKIGNVILHVFLILAALVFLVPIYILFRNSLMTDTQITSWEWIWFAIPPHWENYPDLFADILVPMATGFRNSALIALSTVVLQTTIACMAGYALGRIPAQGKGLVLAFILSTMLIPGTALFVPLFVLVAKIGWVNTIQGLIVPGIFSAFNTFMFRQYFLSFPSDLEDAGRVDGLGYFGTFVRLALPNSWPIIIALGSLTLVNSWNAFLWPLLIGQNPKWWTVQVNLSGYLTAQVVKLNMAFAGAFLAALPMLIVFFALQRYIAAGITRSGIKG